MDSIDSSGIPYELKELRQWVGWRRSPSRGKVPVQVNGKAARVNDSSTWGTFNELIESGRQLDGVGFVLTDSPYIGIDIDDCMDGGRLQRKAWKVVERFGSYAELSPSGSGVHIIGRGRAVFPSSGSQDGRRLSGAMGFKSFEVYNSARYLTVTGRFLDGYREVVDVQDVLDRMTVALWPKQSVEQERAAGVQEPGTQQDREQEPLDDSFLMQRASSGRRGEWFRTLYEHGDIARYGGDHSRADMALLGELAFWPDGAAVQMERIFSASALGRREKWRGRQDYRARTIQAALSHWDGKGYRKGR